MGNSQSKTKNGDHLYHGETPVQFTYGLLNTLQQTSESDNTRTKFLDLEIQSRIASELARMEAHGNDIIKSSNQEIEAVGSESQSTLDRKAVSDSISKISDKLSSQTGSFAESKEMEKAKGALVDCLRANDRRPLDCWSEVENFKKEVSKLEKQFVRRLLGDE